MRLLPVTTSTTHVERAEAQYVLKAAIPATPSHSVAILRTQIGDPYKKPTPATDFVLVVFNE